MAKSKPPTLGDHVSESFKALNPSIYAPAIQPSSPASMALDQKTVVSSQKGRRRRKMNGTEREFSMMLEKMRLAGEIHWWGFESTTLRWGVLDNIQYTPDFTVIRLLQIHDGIPPEYPQMRISYIEIKGGFIRPAGIQKFKAVRSEFKLFEFQFWQKQPTGWKQLY